MSKRYIDEYIKEKSWQTKENANLSYSLSSLQVKLSGEAISEYLLDKVYPKKTANAHKSGDLHIHNLYNGMMGYCAGWSVIKILKEGFNGVPRKTESSPPKHFSTALLQLANFIGTLQNEWSGAQALNDLDIFLSPYVRKDKLTYKQVKQEMQQFIYNLNISSRFGGQTPFTNISFSLTPPPDLNQYQKFQKEIDMINQAFMEIMIEGDKAGRVFTFPIPTYSITKDFDWHSKIANLLFKMTAKFGIPYFQNCVNGNIDPRLVRSMCCRLMLDLKQLHKREGGFFGYADQTGSIGVVTINLPRIARKAKNEKEFLSRLEGAMTIAKDSLEIKRKLVEQNIKNGLLPFTKRYLGSLNFHFSTIGTIGMHEACLNLFGKGIESAAGQEFALRVLIFMREKLLKFQKQTKHVYNLEATPAEGASYRLAKIDKEKYPKIITSGTKTVPYYTNSSWLPVDYTEDLFKALKHQGPLQIQYTGGTVFHIFLGERISDLGCKTLVKKIVENFSIPYFTVTPTFSICQKHGYLKGEVAACPKCRSETEVYSRVVGYFRPIHNWHLGKKEEFKNRKEYRPIIPPGSH